MNYTSHDSVLLQVVIGGINVDFVAKGETKTLRVRTSLLRIAVLSHTLANSHLVVPSSLGRPTQDVCSSHLEALVATSLVRFYTITSHVHSISPDLNFAACFFFFKTPWVGWAGDHFSSPLLELIPTAMPCLNTVNTWWVCNSGCEIILSRYVNLQFSLSVRTWVVWPGYSSRAQLPTAPLWLTVEKWFSDWETWTFISRSQRNM